MSSHFRQFGRQGAISFPAHFLTHFSFVSLNERASPVLPPMGQLRSPLNTRSAAGRQLGEPSSFAPRSAARRSCASMSRQMSPLLARPRLRVCACVGPGLRPALVAPTTPNLRCGSRLVQTGSRVQYPLRGGGIGPAPDVSEPATNRRSPRMDVPDASSIGGGLRCSSAPASDLAFSSSPP